MLWLCVPFGLFTPEDLVLVAAIPDMQDTEDQIDFAMLGWYFAEKADYRQARNYLSRLTSEDEFVQAVKGIIEEKLRQAGMLSESQFYIFHAVILIDMNIEIMKEIRGFLKIMRKSI